MSAARAKAERLASALRAPRACRRRRDVAAPPPAREQRHHDSEREERQRRGGDARRRRHCPARRSTTTGAQRRCCGTSAGNGLGRRRARRRDRGRSTCAAAAPASADRAGARRSGRAIALALAVRSRACLTCGVGVAIALIEPRALGGDRRAFLRGIRGGRCGRAACARCRAAPGRPRARQASCAASVAPAASLVARSPSAFRGKSSRCRVASIWSIASLTCVSAASVAAWSAAGVCARRSMRRGRGLAFPCGASAAACATADGGREDSHAVRTQAKMPASVERNLRAMRSPGDRSTHARRREVKRQRNQRNAASCRPFHARNACRAVRTYFAAGRREPDAAGDGGDIDQSECGHPGSQRDEQAGDGAEPVDREEPPPTAEADAGQRGDQRPAQPPGALRGEIEREADAEEAVERADDAQIERADLDHRRRRRRTATARHAAQARRRARSPR